MPGYIAKPDSIDTLSTAPLAVSQTTEYPPGAIGGEIYECETIYSDDEKVNIIDPEESVGKYNPETGVPKLPAVVANYPSIQRSKLIPTQNLEATGVYFENKLVPVTGDHMLASPTTVPPTRPIIDGLLTPGTDYPTILIGTQIT